jgi:hypothetical protein
MRHGGESVLFTENEEDADQVLAAIMARHPEVMTGYFGDWIELVDRSSTAALEMVERQSAKVSGMSPQELDQWLAERYHELLTFPRRLNPNAP